jgi:hypothetical protein
VRFPRVSFLAQRGKGECRKRLCCCSLDLGPKGNVVGKIDCRAALSFCQNSSSPTMKVKVRAELVGVLYKVEERGERGRRALQQPQSVFARCLETVSR